MLGDRASHACLQHHDAARADGTARQRDESASPVRNPVEKFLRSPNGSAPPPRIVVTVLSSPRYSLARLAALDSGRGRSALVQQVGRELACGAFRLQQSRSWRVPRVLCTTQHTAAAGRATTPRPHLSVSAAARTTPALLAWHEQRAPAAHAEPAAHVHRDDRLRMRAGCQGRRTRRRGVRPERELELRGHAVEIILPR